jgi:hypothetical protein
MPRKKAIGNANTSGAERKANGPDRKHADAGRNLVLGPPPANSNASAEIGAVRNAGTHGTQNPHSLEARPDGRGMPERAAILLVSEAANSTPFAIIGSPVPANDTVVDPVCDLDPAKNSPQSAMGSIPEPMRQQFIDALVELLIADLGRRPP